MIRYGCQSISEEDIAAVDAVMRSDFLTQGPAVPAFEAAIAQFCGAEHAVAVNSASSGLNLACMALELGPGDRLWTSPVSFVASANCARHCGAQVDFVDIDPATLNLCPRQLAEKLERAERDGTLPRIVLPVHFAGAPCDMEAIAALSERYGFSVIEDAAHALGAEHQGIRVGSCAKSRMTVFSFHPVKLITTGEGGMITTSDAELERRLQMLRSHGITREPSQLEQQDEGGWYYEQQMLGYNCRMTDIQAALGCSQLPRIGEFLRRRRELAERYERLLEDMPLRRPRFSAADGCAWHLYVVQLPPQHRRAVYDALRAADIGVNVHYIPVHLQPYYRRLGFRRGDFPASEAYYDGALTLPLHPHLTDEQQDRVVATLRRALEIP